MSSTRKLTVRTQQASKVFKTHRFACTHVPQHKCQLELISHIFSPRHPKSSDVWAFRVKGLGFTECSGLGAYGGHLRGVGFRVEGFGRSWVSEIRAGNSGYLFHLCSNPMGLLLKSPLNPKTAKHQTTPNPHLVRSKLQSSSSI